MRKPLKASAAAGLGRASLMREPSGWLMTPVAVGALRLRRRRISTRLLQSAEKVAAHLVGYLNNWKNMHQSIQITAFEFRSVVLFEWIAIGGP